MSLKIVTAMVFFSYFFSNQAFAGSYTPSCSREIRNISTEEILEDVSLRTIEHGLADQSMENFDLSHFRIRSSLNVALEGVRYQIFTADIYKNIEGQLQRAGLLSFYVRVENCEIVKSEILLK
jgi:hypothetical protein